MFNQEARWDRSILKKDSNDLNEPIRVVAVFECGKILPRSFSWHQKPYPVTKITYFWQERQGRELLNLFCVETPNGLYQISFSNQSLSWRLNKIL